MSQGEEAETTLAADNDDNAVKLQNSDANIKVMHLDVNDYHSVASFAAAVKSDVPALHLLTLNAVIACLEHGYGSAATSDQ